MSLYDSIISAIKEGKHFSLSRWGDGEFAALFGDSGANCDGVVYENDMRNELESILSKQPHYNIGKQPYHANLYTKQRIAQIDGLGRKWVNADVLHDASKENKLRPFLQALKGKDVTIIGNAQFRKLETVFEFNHIEIDGTKAWQDRHEILSKVPQSGVVLFACGITSNWLIDKSHNGKRTLIDIGSLLDPFCGNNSRKYHNVVSKAQATPIHVTMATVPIREKFAIQSVKSLLKNTWIPDTFHLELNGFSEVPKWVTELPITYTLRPENIGAKAKFARLKDCKGYYLTVDDDIEYPSSYIYELVRNIELTGNKSICGYHGSTHKILPIKSYWKDVARKFHFADGLKRRALCSMLGTGTMGFHTSIMLSYAVFEKGNQTDPYLSKWCISKGIKQIAVDRPIAYLKQIKGSQDTGKEIWRSAMNNDTEQTKVINSIDRTTFIKYMRNNLS